MSDNQEREIQSIQRMLLYLKGEMQRNGLDVATKHVDDCIASISKIELKDSESNVINIFESLRKNSADT